MQALLSIALFSIAGLPATPHSNHCCSSFPAPTVPSHADGLGPRCRSPPSISMPHGTVPPGWVHPAMLSHPGRAENASLFNSPRAVLCHYSAPPCTQGEVFWHFGCPFPCRNAAALPVLCSSCPSRPAVTCSNVLCHCQTHSPLTTLGMRP